MFGDKQLKSEAKQQKQHIYRNKTYTISTYEKIGILFTFVC